MENYFELYRRLNEIESVEEVGGTYRLTFVNSGEVRKSFRFKKKELMKFIINNGLYNQLYQKEYANYCSLYSTVHFELEDLIGLRVFVYLNEDMEIVGFERYYE